MNKSIKILFIGNGDSDPSYRYRVKQYVDRINSERKSDFIVKEYTLLPDYQLNRKPLLLYIFCKKVFSLIACANSDVVFLQRNPVKILSPYYEFIIKKILRKKLIFDFDDSIWVINGKYDVNIQKIIRLSDMVIVGNEFLSKFSMKFNKETHVINTIIDTDIYRPVSSSKHQEINVCWIGSKPSNHYLEKYERVFTEIKEYYNEKINFYFVSDKRPIFSHFNGFTFLKWTKQIEAEVLAISDIGIMPLIDNEFSRGKCGFKLIQYGAYGLALLASPIGLNNKIVKDGINGYLVTTDEEWIFKLRHLVEKPNLLAMFKTAARKTVVEDYSLNSQFSNFKNLLRTLWKDQN